MFNNKTRSRLAPLVGGLVATSMLTFTAGSATAVQPGSAGSATTVVASSAEVANQFGTMTSKVKGTFGKNGTVTGTFEPKRFKKDGGKLWAVGTLTSTAKRGNGTVVFEDEVTKGVAVPLRKAEGQSVGRTAARAVGDCEILNLVLGPLDLDLLGLKVHLDKVVLNITAEPGSGNLLGNLLCSVVSLLDGAGALVDIAHLLNRILEIPSGLLG